MSLIVNVNGDPGDEKNVSSIRESSVLCALEVDQRRIERWVTETVECLKRLMAKSRNKPIGPIPPEDAGGTGKSREKVTEPTPVAKTPAKDAGKEKGDLIVRTYRFVTRRGFKRTKTVTLNSLPVILEAEAETD